MLELLNSIGRARPGTRLLVCEPFDAADAAAGGVLHLPVGTRLEIAYGLGGSLSAYAEVSGQLRHVHIFARDYHRLELSR
jgi:hypothetical protein